MKSANFFLNCTIREDANRQKPQLKVEIEDVREAP